MISQIIHTVKLSIKNSNALFAFIFLGLEHVLITLSANSSLIQQWDRVITGALIVLVVLFFPRGLLQLVGARGAGGWRALAATLRASRV